MSASAQHIKAIFGRALEFESPADRNRYLNEACGGHAELRAEVEALLRSLENAEGFLEPPASETSPIVQRPAFAETGSLVGPYKLLQEIGEGGMGVVYMAEQQEPVRRKVALKLIKPGMDTRQVIARFEAERQALALMDHPNIARVFDAAATDSGRPYFVMELVHGVPITQYCDDRRLTLRQRLTLFIPVCQAVQHAHQKGIIHRDLKPTNVLVADYDERPVVKIIDFGVAKATGQQLTEKTMFTEFGQVVGTIEYMSPEQAKLNQLDIDTRTDVYSLGVLLYELLAGETPFDKQRLRLAALDEMLRIIREDEPPKPSTRLSHSETLPSIAANRHLEPRKLTALVRGELDWIVMKCLEKDRNRRYETASGLAADLQHHLQDEPVQACPPSAGYRFRKMVRRNKLPFAAAGAVVAALVLGTLFSTWQAVRATRAEAQATAARTEAETNFRKAVTAVDEMLTEVGQESLANIPHMEPVRRALLERALRFYQGFLQERGNEPQIRLETGRAYQRVSDIYYMLGQHLAAEQACRQALSILEELEAEFPDSPTYREEAAQSYDRLGFLIAKMRLAESARIAEAGQKAEIAFRQALVRYEKLAVEHPDEPRFRHALANNYSHLARLLSILGRNRAAEDSYRSAVDVHAELSARFPASLEYHESLGNHYNQLAELLQHLGRRPEAEASIHQALQLQRKLAADAPDMPDYQRALALSLYRLGLLLGGRSVEAESAFREATVLQEKLVEDFPNVWDYRWELTFTLDNLGQMLRRDGRSAEAQIQFKRAVEIYLPTLAHRERLADEHSGEKGPQIWLAASYMRQGRLLQAAGQSEDAIDLFRKAVGVHEKLVAEDPDGRLILATTHIRLGSALRSVARDKEAAEAYQRAGKLLKECLSQAPSSTHDPTMLNNVAWQLATMPDPQFLDSALAVKLATLAAKRAPRDRYIWNTLGVAHYRAGDWQAALESLNKSMKLGQGGDGTDWFFLAMAEWQRGNQDAARAWYDKAGEWMDVNNPADEELIRFRTEAEELLHRKKPADAEAGQPQAVEAQDQADDAAEK